jgi:hypothetical protein
VLMAFTVVDDQAAQEGARNFSADGCWDNSCRSISPDRALVIFQFPLVHRLDDQIEVGSFLLCSESAPSCRSPPPSETQTASGKPDAACTFILPALGHSERELMIASATPIVATWWL